MCYYLKQKIKSVQQNMNMYDSTCIGAVQACCQANLPEFEIDFEAVITAYTPALVFKH